MYSRDTLCVFLSSWTLGRSQTFIAFGVGRIFVNGDSVWLLIFHDDTCYLAYIFKSEILVLSNHSWNIHALTVPESWRCSLTQRTCRSLLDRQPRLRSIDHSVLRHFCAKHRAESVWPIPISSLHAISAYDRGHMCQTWSCQPCTDLTRTRGFLYILHAIW